MSLYKNENEKRGAYEFEWRCWAERYKDLGLIKLIWFDLIGYVCNKETLTSKKAALGLGFGFGHEFNAIDWDWNFEGDTNNIWFGLLVIQSELLHLNPDQSHPTFFIIYQLDPCFALLSYFFNRYFREVLSKFF